MAVASNVGKFIRTVCGPGRLDASCSVAGPMSVALIRRHNDRLQSELIPAVISSRPDFVLRLGNELPSLSTRQPPQ